MYVQSLLLHEIYNGLKLGVSIRSNVPSYIDSFSLVNINWVFI